MGVREQITRHPGWAWTAGATLLVAAVLLILAQLRANAPRPYTGKAFFSTDDGKTWFEDDIEKLPPFEHDGKTAYRAYVFTCDGGKTQWVGYLQRYAKAIREKNNRARRGTGPITDGIELKRPGDAEWIPQSEIERARALLEVTCGHDNPDHAIEPVNP
jgi:hypothetical protein